MKIPNSLSDKFGRQTLVLKKHSPTILFGAGLVGFGTTVVLASKATLNLEHVIDDARMDLDAVKGADREGYTERMRQQDIVTIYSRSVFKLGKLYFPAIVVGGLSVAALTQSHNILNDRVAGLTAAYTLLDKGFSEYRERVIDKYGEDEDREFLYGVDEVKVKGKDGKSKTIKVVKNDGMPSMYARFFDDSSTSWDPDPEKNMIFLRIQQCYWNDRLKARGYVLLNEVYEGLRLPKSSAGAQVGWVYGGDGDNKIDFGLYDDSERARDFVNGHEGVKLLDFNVDGVVFDLIDELEAR